MGYYSDVTLVTTKKGWEYCKAHARDIYAKKLRETEEVVDEDDNFVTTVNDMGIKCLHSKKAVDNLLDHPQRYMESDGYERQWVLVEWYSIKWLGYNFKDQQAIMDALSDSGEPVKEICIGEDGATDENTYNDFYGRDDYPEVEVVSQVEFDEGRWEDKGDDYEKHL